MVLEITSMSINQEGMCVRIRVGVCDRRGRPCLALNGSLDALQPPVVRVRVSCVGATVLREYETTRENVWL